jgi:predicted alpha/beta superfamily hydrolase
MPLAAAATLAAAVASAQDPDLPRGVTALGPVTLELSQSYTIASMNVDQVFQIDVVRIATPFTSPAARLPVTFVMDGNALGRQAALIARGAALEAVPAMYVVGVGYDVDQDLTSLDLLVDINTRRVRDFTPSVDEEYLGVVSTFVKAQTGRSYPGYGQPGGADAFLAFLNEELKPFIAARYPDANIDDTALVGHSLGGLFTLHVLFTSPQSFDRYIAISPAASYDDGLLFKEETALGDVPARLFLAVGQNDQPEIVNAVPRLDSQIRTHDRPGLRYGYGVFDGATHVTVLPGALMRGFTAVFDPSPPPLGSAPPPRRE